MVARRVVLAVPAVLADTVPARRVMFTTPGRWKCGKWHPPVDHTVREAYAVCVGRRKRPAPGVRAQWPAGWLAGLGTPWNTLQLGGWLRLSSPGLVLESVAGRWRFDGRAEIALDAISSRLSTLPSLGSYRINVAGTAATGDAGITLSTTEGPLQLSGSGQWAASQLRFRGEARAAEGSEAVLNNLLNLIGRRQGALSVISIG